jgi:hypothetical protein
MPRCNGCGATFRTVDGLDSHLSQKRFKRCRAAYHSSDGLLEQYGLTSDDSLVTVDPAGDYFGAYDSYTQDDIADHTESNIDSVAPEAMTMDADGLGATMMPFGGEEDDIDGMDAATSDSASEGGANDLDELEDAAAALECEGGWEPDASPASTNSQATPLLSHTPFPPIPPYLDSPNNHARGSPSPPLVFTPSPPSSRSSSPSLALSDTESDEEGPRNTPYCRLFQQSPFIDPFPDASAGSPLPDQEESANAAYQASLGGAQNPYFPFANELDWLVARWAKLRGPSSTALTELLQIPGVRSPFSLFL